MRSISNAVDNYSKDKLRSEINIQIQDFLHNGGRIEVLGIHPQSGSSTRFCSKLAASDEMGLHSLDFD